MADTMSAPNGRLAVGEAGHNVTSYHRHWGALHILLGSYALRSNILAARGRAKPDLDPPTPAPFHAGVWVLRGTSSLCWPL